MIDVLPLTLPLGIAVGAALAWWSWRRFADPPRLSAYPTRIQWMVDPWAWLDRDLRNGRLAWAIFAIHERLVQELDRHFFLSTEEIHARFPRHRLSGDPLLPRALRLARRLDYAWRLAYLAESPWLTDAWSRWRRPVWSLRARKIFEEGLSEVRGIWPQLEAHR